MGEEDEKVPSSEDLLRIARDGLDEDPPQNGSAAAERYETEHLSTAYEAPGVPEPIEIAEPAHSTPAQATPRAVPPAAPYKSARTRARWAQIFIGLVGIITIFEIWAIWVEVQLLRRIEDGIAVSTAEATASDDRLTTLYGLFLLAFIPAVIVYSFWISRAFRNLEHVRSGNSLLKFSPGWAVGGYYVPFLNIFQPFQVMRELYKESHPETKTSSLVGWWWGLWLIGGWVAAAVGTASSEPVTLSEAIFADYRFMIQDVLLAAAAILIILIINRILSWQESRAKQVGII